VTTAARSFFAISSTLALKTAEIARTRKRTTRPFDNLDRRGGRRSGLSTAKSAGDHFALHNEPIEIYTGSKRLILLPIARDRTLAKSCALCIRSHASAVLPIAFSSFAANSGAIAERPTIMLCNCWREREIASNLTSASGNVVDVNGAITKVESFGIGTAQAAEMLASASVNVTKQAKRIHEQVRAFTEDIRAIQTQYVT
jgi:hypothetical protein